MCPMEYKSPQGNPVSIQGTRNLLAAAAMYDNVLGLSRGTRYQVPGID